jgi:hypothetical protein
MLYDDNFVISLPQENVFAAILKALNVLPRSEEGEFTNVTTDEIFEARALVLALGELKNVPLTNKVLVILIGARPLTRIWQRQFWSPLETFVFNNYTVKKVKKKREILLPCLDRHLILDYRMLIQKEYRFLLTSCAT